MTKPRIFSFLLLATLVVGASQITACTAQAESSWEAVDDITNAAHERHESAFVQAGGRYYMIGGRGMKPIDIYDPASNSWSQGKVPPIELHHFQAVEHDGLIYVIAALSGPYPFEVPSSHIYIYDPLQDRWMTGPEIPPQRRRGAAGVTEYNGKIFVVAGIVNGHTSGWVPWLDEFDPVSNSWRQLADAPRSRDHFQAAMIDGRLYAAGGRRSGYDESMVFAATVAEVDVYDMESDSWATLPASANIPTQRAGVTAVAVNGELLVLGGESPAQETAHKEVEAFSPADNTWRSLAPLLTPRHGTQVIANSDGLFVSGGCARRGGEPEVVALERLAIKIDTVAQEQALQAGRLELQSSQDIGGGRYRVEVANHGGNQALLLSTALAVGGAAVEIDQALPIILAPGGSVSINVSGVSDDDTLILKSLQYGLAPLSISF